MNVEGLAEFGLAHRRAFDMPARPAAPPGAVPARLLRGRRLPQYEIAGVALIGRDLDTSAGDHLVAAAPRQLAVRWPRSDREQRVALGGIGMPGRDQPLDQRDHLRDVSGRARLDIRRQCAERRHVGVKLSSGPRRQGVDRLAAFPCGGDDLVLDVGDIADIADMRGAVGMAQHAVEQIEGDDGPAIADMRQIVDRRAADIHPDLLAIERLERLLAAGQRIVQDKRHRAGDQANRDQEPFR